MGNKKLNLLELQMQTFILEPTRDDMFGMASRHALLEFANRIEDWNPELAKDLRECVQNCRDGAL